MNHSFKKFTATLLTVILLMVLSVPFSAYAQKGTLGTENPRLTATFKDGDDIVVDGNELEAGSYTVDIHLSGMKTVSIFQITANISNMVINNVSTIADSDSSFSCGAIVNEDDSFVAILASENDDTSAIADGAVMVTLDVTIDTAGDFEEFFVLSTDPDLTFIEADYGDGYDDAYVCTVNSTQPYANITFDMSPSLAKKTFTVSGKISIATDLEATEGEVGVTGITVSVVGTDISTTTASDGSFTLYGVPEGTYTLLIAGDTTIDRTVTINVTEDMALPSIPIIICDYNGDRLVDDLDKTKFNTSFAGEFYIYCDFNADGVTDDLDKISFNVFYGNGEIQYPDLTFQLSVMIIQIFYGGKFNGKII